MIQLAALILAAGAGKRIGRAKALLPLGDSTFLESIISNLRIAGIDRIIAVVSPEILPQIESHHVTGEIAVNSEPQADMWSSLLVGIKKIETVSGCLIIPVDHPFVKAETYRLLLEIFAKQPEHIVVPTHHGQSGHPVVLPFVWAKTLPAMNNEGGLRSAIKQSGLNVFRIETNDAGVLRNINKPSDLETAH